MESAILILLMICLYSFQSFCCKKYTDTYPGRADLASPVFTAVSGVVVAIISLCFMGFRFSATSLTVLLGVLNALSITGFNYFMVKTSQSGPYTILMLFAIAGGIITPTIAALFFGVVPSFLKCLGVAVVIVGVYVSSYRKDESETDLKVFIPACLGLALSNGAHASITDMQQRLTGAAEKEELVCITYFVAAVISMAILAFKLLGKGDGAFGARAYAKAFKQSRISLFFLVVTSVIAGTAINLLVIIIGLLNDITLLYTLNNSGILLMSALLSFIFLKEKINKINLLGYVIMCGAMVLVSLF